jgi:hypothetical protein
VPVPEGFSEQRLDMLILETHKATTAFFDRLLLVNAGTLSLVVTVGTTALLTSQHPLSLDAWSRQRILVGCYLFALSFFFCLLHNYLKLPGMATTLSYSMFREQAMGKWMKVITYTCTALGIFAGVSTVAGYFLLVRAIGSLPLQAHH